MGIRNTRQTRRTKRPHLQSTAQRTRFRNAVIASSCIPDSVGENRPLRSKPCNHFSEGSFAKPANADFPQASRSSAVFRFLGRFSQIDSNCCPESTVPKTGEVWFDSGIVKDQARRIWSLCAATREQAWP